MKKRLISCLMALTLVFSILPANALADEVQEEPSAPVTEEVQPAAEEQEETPESPEGPEEQPQEIETPQEEPETAFAPAAQEGGGRNTCSRGNGPRGLCGENRKKGRGDPVFRDPGQGCRSGPNW